MRNGITEIKCGDKFSRPAERISQELVAALAEMTGESMVQSALVSTLISAVLGKELPQTERQPTCCLSQTSSFKFAVSTGDEITAYAEVECFINMTLGDIRLNTWCTNQDGTIVTEGNAVVRVDPRLLAFG